MKGPLQALPQILIRHLPSLPIHPPGALGGGKVTPVKVPRGYQHVASGKPWVGEVSLLQNYHSIPDMLIQKMYPRRRPRRRLSQTVLSWAASQASRGQEFHTVRP